MKGVGVYELLYNMNQSLGGFLFSFFFLFFWGSGEGGEGNNKQIV